MGDARRQSKGLRQPSVIPAGGGAVTISLGLFSAAPYNQGFDPQQFDQLVISAGFLAANPGNFGALTGALSLGSPIVLDENAQNVWSALMPLATLAASGSGFHGFIPNVPASALILTVTGAGNIAGEAVELVLGAAVFSRLVAVTPAVTRG